MVIRKTTLVGVLVADKWEANGKISGLALLTDDERKYLIHPEDVAQDIMSMLRRKIKVTGLLKNKAHKKIICVTDFCPVCTTE